MRWTQSPENIKFIGALFATCWLLSGASPVFAAETELLLDRRSGRVEAGEKPGHHAMAFNEHDAFTLRPGQASRLSLPSGAVYPAILERVQAHASGAATWIGRLDGSRDDHRVIVTRGAQGDVQGTIQTPEGVFLLRSVAGKQVLIDVRASGRRQPIPTRDDALQPPQRGNLLDGERLSSPSSDSPTAQAAPVKEAAVGNSTIDVMVLYTPELVTAYGSDSAARTRIDHLVAIANQAYVNSGVAMTLRLRLARLVSYPRTNDIDTALDNLTASENSGLPSHVTMSDVATWKQQFGADLVALVRPLDTQVNPNTCGLAWLVGAGGSDVANDRSWAYAVSNDGDDVRGSGVYCDDYTFTHELGHNMGSAHDPAHAGSQGAYPYSYGHGADGVFGTIMSYIDPTVGKFSNPGINCNGQPCGIADQRDNARSLNNTRTAVAWFTTATEVPGSPTLVRLVPGNGSMAVHFNAPVSNGGTAITSYTARCTAGASTKTATGSSSPIVVTGLINKTSYSCSVHANNALGAGAESSTLTKTAGRRSLAPLLNMLLGD